MFESLHLQSSASRVLPAALAACAMSLFVLASPSTAEAACPDGGAQPPGQGGREKDAAIIIGIEDYVFVPDVEGAASNAQAWYTYLVRGRSVPVLAH